MEKQVEKFQILLYLQAGYTSLALQVSLYTHLYLFILTYTFFCDEYK